MKWLVVLILMLWEIAAHAQPKGSYRAYSPLFPSGTRVTFSGKRIIYKPLYSHLSNFEAHTLKGWYKTSGDTITLNAKKQPKAGNTSHNEMYNLAHKDSLRIMFPGALPRKVRVNDVWYGTNWYSANDTVFTDTLSFVCPMPRTLKYIVAEGWFNTYAPVYIKNEKSNEIVIVLDLNQDFRYYHLFNERYLYHIDSLVKIPMWEKNEIVLIKEKN
ncbi:MAG: hypothetical protein EOP51_01350 [Sphingobacteriales bacterium]|nr:MAG: hypothetical protein EOP51_01350 [Sphingobacteriales bacterium]